jgi:hypothetical protein
MNNNTRKFSSFFMALVLLVPSFCDANVLYNLRSHFVSPFGDGTVFDVDLSIDSPTFLSSTQDSYFGLSNMASCTVSNPSYVCKDLFVQVNSSGFYGSLAPDTIQLIWHVNSVSRGFGQGIYFQKDALSNVGIYLGLNGAGNSLQVSQSIVPLPASIWLMGSGLIGLAGLARRKK